MALKTINIHGRNYVMVNERISHFNEKYTNGSIATDVVYEGDYVRVKATITPDINTPARFFTGHAEEDRKQGNINKTSATENAETSAIGRALGLMGIGILDSIASAEEVVHALHKEVTSEPVKEIPTATGQNGIVCNLNGCNGIMRLRKGRNGEFYGCSNYGKGCRNTMSVDEVAGIQHYDEHYDEFHAE